MGWPAHAVYGHDSGQYVYSKCLLAISDYVTVWLASPGWSGSGRVLRARNFDYVRAARALGVKDHAIIFRHILPNAMSSSLSQLPFMLTANITALTALDFLGYGLPPDAASLGKFCCKGKIILMRPGWLYLVFSLALVLSLLIYIGEATRDAFDPRRQ